jgi:RTX calcium-binding nonapeptide repeat (4 copies)
MANITGTNGKDTLTGTAADDVIKGLDGNDKISGSLGKDTIDGGAGNDTVDYSGAEFAGKYLALQVTPSNSRYNQPDGLSVSVDAFTNNSKFDQLVNIETIIANKSTPGSIEIGGPDIDIDLSKNRVTYSVIPLGQNNFVRKTINVQNFQFILSGGPGRFKGNDLNNQIFVDTASTVIGSKGNDFMAGGPNLDYSNIGTAVTLVASQGALTIRKGGFGTDTSAGGTKKVIGATNKANTVTGESFAPLDVNLATNTAKLDSYSIEIINFVNALGTTANDKIVGSNKSGKLTGGGGNDIITGGNSKDIITGSDSTARGVGEVDTLTGGGGRDKFVLGDKNGAYYVGKGNHDYALITDFDLFKDSISIGKLKNYSFALEGSNTIDLYSGKDVNTRDLIAKIQIAGGISSVSSNNKSVMGADANLNEIVRKIDITSGSDDY